MSGRGPKEEAYDEELAPLLARVNEICERLGINFYACFCLDGMPGGSDVVGRIAAVHDPADQAGVGLVNRIHLAVSQACEPLDVGN